MSEGIPFKLKRRSWREVMPHFISEVEAEIRAAVLAERKRCIEDQCVYCNDPHTNTISKEPTRGENSVPRDAEWWHESTICQTVREFCHASEIHERVYQEELNSHERARQEQATP